MQVCTSVLHVLYINSLGTIIEETPLHKLIIESIDDGIQVVVNKGAKLNTISHSVSFYTLQESTYMIISVSGIKV
jgi:hypothetical protein